MHPAAGVTRRRDNDFQDFVRTSRAGLLRTAVLLASGDGYLAEDIVQITLTRLYLAWPRIQHVNLDAYARRVLVHCLVDEKRRPAVRWERVHDDPPERLVHDPHDLGETDDELVRVLAGLPPRMRAAVVLRHVDGLSVNEAARVLGCSRGTVKSQTARGLDKLRDALADRVGQRP